MTEVTELVFLKGMMSFQKLKLGYAVRFHLMEKYSFWADLSSEIS